MTRPSSGAGSGTYGLFQFGVEVVVAPVHSSFRDLRHLLIAQILRPDHLARPALELAVLIDRYHHQALAAVAGDRDGLGQGFVLIPAEMTLKLGCGHGDHPYNLRYT